MVAQANRDHYKVTCDAIKECSKYGCCSYITMTSECHGKGEKLTIYSNQYDQWLSFKPKTICVPPHMAIKVHYKPAYGDENILKHKGITECQEDASFLVSKNLKVNY